MSVMVGVTPLFELSDQGTGGRRNFISTSMFAAKDSRLCKAFLVGSALVQAWGLVEGQGRGN